LFKLEYAEIFACPRCGSSMKLGFDVFQCDECRIKYKFRRGIPVLFKEQDENRKKDEVQKGYQKVFHSLQEYGLAEYSSFLNLGYADVDEEGRKMRKKEQLSYKPNKTSVQLLYELIGEYSLDGHRVLEVGCGRGGNLAELGDMFQPKLLAGLDLCFENVYHCSKIHRLKNGFFCEGDAQRLPFQSGCFDDVVNIESSHSYPEIKSFYREVYRVLSDEGVFFYTDVMPVEKFKLCEVLLKEIGFKIAESRDITRNVLKACEEKAKRRATVFDNVNMQNDMLLLADFLGIPGSDIYQEMKEREQIYKIIVLRKHAYN